MDVVVTLVVLAVLGAAAYAFLRRRKTGGPRSEARALIEDCNGDQELAERLIFAEMQRDDAMTLSAAVRAARQRLKRDRVD